MNPTLSGMINNATGQIMPTPVAQFNPDARTPMELCTNLHYLASESGRWVEIVESMPEDHGVLDAAQATAEKLVSQASLLVIRLRRVALERAAGRMLRGQAVPAPMEVVG